MLEKREFYINGQWVSPVRTNDFEVIDPSTEESCAVISLGAKEDTDAAVAAARNAFESWSQTSKEERMALLENSTPFTKHVLVRWLKPFQLRWARRWRWLKPLNGVRVQAISRT